MVFAAGTNPVVGTAATAGNRLLCRRLILPIVWRIAGPFTEYGALAEGLRGTAAAIIRLVPVNGSLALIKMDLVAVFIDISLLKIAHLDHFLQIFAGCVFFYAHKSSDVGNKDQAVIDDGVDIAPVSSPFRSFLLSGAQRG